MFGGTTSSRWPRRGSREWPVILLVALSAAQGCGRLVIGAVPTPDGGGADGPPAKSAAITAWEPRSADPAARVTSVRVGMDQTYVGFSNGEIYYRANTGAAAWSRADLIGNVGGQLTPRMAVTSLVIDPLQPTPSVMVGYAGGSGAHTFWCAANNGQFWYEGTISNDVWAISSSPFEPADILIVTDSATWALVGCAGALSLSAPGSFPINFPGTAEAFAEGIAPDGTRRAWLGDSVGGVHYADFRDATATPSWTAVRAPGFPDRPVLAIAVDSQRPERVWVTFRGLSDDTLWSSDDNGATWTNRWPADLTGSPPSGGSLTAVSLVPALDLAYVTALRPGAAGSTTVLSFWTVGREQPWSPD